MKNGWMIRAGNGGRYFDDFKDNDCVAIGWNSLGESRNYKSPEALREAYIQHFGNAEPEQIGEFRHISKVKWLGCVSWDQFSQATRNSLGSVLTVFSLSDTVISEVQDRLAGRIATILIRPEEGLAKPRHIKSGGQCKFLRIPLKKLLN